jgi:hypothetical protein
MTSWASALVAALLAAQTIPLFRFQDDAIDESSGLVAGGDSVLTVNDSGDAARVFVVDRRSGQTVGVTTYSDVDPVDVEAIAAGPGERLWVGDIGDNEAERDHVTVYVLPAPEPGDRTVHSTAYDLVYEGGPRDAETLLLHPRTGRLYVVSKGLLGGTVFAAPRTLHADRTNVLVPVGSAGGLVTDGAFLPDGRHAVLRDYSSAVVVRSGDFQPIGRFGLPEQEQGEGISVLGDRVVVSSEGQHSAVLAQPIPKRVLRAMEPPEAVQPAPPTQERDHGGGTVVPAALGAAWVLLLLLVARTVIHRKRRTADRATTPGPRAARRRSRCRR